jgi:hypothetical protein
MESVMLPLAALFDVDAAGVDGNEVRLQGENGRRELGIVGIYAAGTFRSAAEAGAILPDQPTGIEQLLVVCLIEQCLLLLIEHGAAFSYRVNDQKRESQQDGEGGAQYCDDDDLCVGGPQWANKNMRLVLISKAVRAG